MIMVTLKAGYTGDPYSACVDIDECSLEEYNTCPGGMYPNGIDIDMFSDLSDYEYGPYYIGPIDSDGIQVMKIFQLE